MKLLGMKILFFITFLSLSTKIHNSLLEHSISKFNCAEMTFEEAPEQFQKCLQETLIYLKKHKVNGVWLTIARNCSELIPLAVKEGFTFHHAKEDKLVLTAWLSKEENYLPAYATRTVGVWVLVIDDNDRILVIKEKYDKDWGYKFPSGAVKMGEEIKDGAVREVKEETGIDAEFMNIIAFVERHNTRMDNISDISFICVLKPLNNHLQNQESEIIDTQWMPLDEFKAIAKGPQKQVITAYEINKNGVKAYNCPDFAGYSASKTMTLYTCPNLPNCR